MFRIILVATFSFFCSTVYSTPACRTPTEDWFLLNVVGKATNVVYAEISENNNKNLREVNVIKNLYGELRKSKLFIKNWLSYDNFYNNSKKTNKKILFLRKKDSYYALANDNWKKCRPSIIYKHPKSNKFYIPFSNKEKTVEANLEHIEKIIRKWFKFSD
jgi:hypothetical protein